MSGGKSELFCWQSTIVPNRPTRRQRQVVGKEMDQAAFESAANVRFRHVVPAHPHALTNARNRLFRTGKPEIMQLDFVAEPPRTLKQADVSSATQRAFQGKGFTPDEASANFLQQQSR